MSLTQSQKEDYRRYYVEDARDFNPMRTLALVDECIRAADIDKRVRKDAYSQQLRERAEAAVAYLFSHKSNFKTIEQYLGQDYLAKMQGQRIVQKVKRLQNGKEIITLEEIL